MMKNYILEMLIKSRDIDTKIMDKARAEADKARVRKAKAEQELDDLLAEGETDLKKDTLSQIAKDIENKVAGAEQKYVAYVEENPELKADEKVRVLYEKCKAKLKK